MKAERWTPSQLRKLVVTGVATGAALFVNPFGYRLVFYPFDLAFRQPVKINHVAEWVSVDFHELRGKIVLVLLVGLLLSALLRNRRWALAELGLVLFALYSGLTYVRFLFLLGIVVAPLLAKLLDFIPPYQPEIDKHVLNAVLMAAMVVAIIRCYPRSAALERSVSDSYPADLLPYLRTHPLHGRMLNHYLWGGYLGWDKNDLKIFIDSRYDIFEYASVFQDYLDLIGIKKVQPVWTSIKFDTRCFHRTIPLITC